MYSVVAVRVLHFEVMGPVPDAEDIREQLASNWFATPCSRTPEWLYVTSSDLFLIPSVLDAVPSVVALGSVSGPGLLLQRAAPAETRSNFRQDLLWGFSFGKPQRLQRNRIVLGDVWRTVPEKAEQTQLLM